MKEDAINLLDQFRQGTTSVHFDSAFETLFHLHQRAVYGWILRIVRNPSAAEELTIETFWRIYQAHAHFDPARGFEGWARRIAGNVALDFLRSERRFEELPAELPSPLVADAAIAGEIRQKTRQAFQRLPPKLRIAATLALIEELPHREIAKALDISLAAVKLRVFRAVRLLRKNLTQQGITP